MKLRYIIPVIFLCAGILLISSSFSGNNRAYHSLYKQNLHTLEHQLQALQLNIQQNPLNSTAQKKMIAAEIGRTRLSMKACDFWLRYLQPVAYKKINGALPVEWETEVFEKYELPYKREGAGLTLALQYLETGHVTGDSLQHLVYSAEEALQTFFADSVSDQLNTYHHFFLCNRLFLLDLATIYTTGFDCPDTTAIIPELLYMMEQTAHIYNSYNEEFPQHLLTNDYLDRYNAAVTFVKTHTGAYEKFDHYRFIKDFVNPLFRLNQAFIQRYKVQSSGYIDYTLNDEAVSIFDKKLYRAQNTKGIFSSITQSSILHEIDSIGKLLFYDPLLSGDNKRSCASCHKLDNYLTDTSKATALKFNSTLALSRNQPSLVNAVYNHLLNLDGKFLTLQDQALGVITNPDEMGNNEKDAVKKILSVPVYKKYLSRFASFTNEKEVTAKHITSALTYFYGKFSNYYSPFDEAMNSGAPLNNDAIEGFNIFMGKAQCGTCHFAPQFNGIKPPYINNEFEVIGVPVSSTVSQLSNDGGRYAVHAAAETKNAFRTPSLRNAALTSPYMHNGVYKTLNEVIDFYDAGGGAGKGITIQNQTLPADSLKLSALEKKQLAAFIHALTENIPFETAPQQLPLSKSKMLNLRKTGGEY